MEEIQTVNVEIQVGKESKDVVDVLYDLIKDIKEGKKVEALMENMSGLLAAVDGYDKLDDEQKDVSKFATRAYLIMKLNEALEYKPAVVAEPVPAA